MKFAIFAAVVAVSVGLFLLLPGKGGGTQAGKESLVERVVQDVPERSSAADERTVSRGNQGRRELERKREKLLEDLRAASSPRIDAQRLLEILAEIKDTNMLLDEDVLNVYSSVVSAFSLDDLVTLTNMWPTKFQDTNMTTARAISQFSQIAKVFRKRDPDQLRIFMLGVPSDHKYRGEMLFMASQRMDVFGPATLLDYIENFSEADKVDISRGVLAQIRNVSKNKDERLDLMSQYLEVVKDPVFYVPIVRLYLDETARDDPKAMLEWVRDHGDPKQAAAWDEPVIRALVKDHPEDASEYVNEILAMDDLTRANKALECMIREYSEIDPAAALNYVLELPQEAAITNQMVADPFTRLVRSDREQAEKIMNEMEDPRIKEMLVFFWEAVKDIE